MRNPSGGGAGHAVPGFLSPFRLSAFASWVILRPLGNWSLPHGRPTDAPSATRRTPTGLSCYAWSRRDRAGRLLNPEDGGALPTGDYPPAGTRRSSAASPYHPADASHRRSQPSRGVIRGSLTFAHHPQDGRPLSRAGKPHDLPAGLLLAHRHRMEQQRLRLRPQASHPAVTHDARRGGDGPSRTGPGTTPRPQPPSMAPPTSLMRPHVARTPRWPP